GVRSETCRRKSPKRASGRPRPRGQGLTVPKAARLPIGCLMVIQTPANKTSGLHKLLHCVGASGESTLRTCWNQRFPSRPYSLRSIFFAAIIGVIVFIALSELLLDPHE